MMLITPATMAAFIRFFRVIAEDAHRAPPRTRLMINAVVTAVYWLCGIPVVTYWIPYLATVRRTARTRDHGDGSGRGLEPNEERGDGSPFAHRPGPIRPIPLSPPGDRRGDGGR